MVSPRQALAWRKWDKCGEVSTDRKIEVNSDPTHRRIARRPGWSSPLPVALSGIESTPYSHSFGDKEEQGLEYDHPDGSPADQLIELFSDLSV